MKYDENWYKSANIYVVYPDAFKNGAKGNLLTLKENLPYVASMGFNAIHVLPFLESPMLDGGFDVSDYFKVRRKLGGNQAFDELLIEAKRLNIRIFMDLVINHVSFQHEWFKKALAGDLYYRNFFIHSTKKPEFLGVEENRLGRFAVYRLGKRNLKARIIFYSKKKVLPHWIDGHDGFWYYHTFYPHQIDLNWTNPDVVRAFSKIVRYWGAKGLNFRVDAVPFAGKRLSKIVREGARGSHEIVRHLHKVFRKVNPDGALLIEACQPVAKTKKYFGSLRQKEAELAYNFEAMRGFWSALISGEARYIWDAIGKTSNIPKHAQWVTFLRNHDELSLEYANPRQRELIYKSLLKSGLDFRGEFGLAGRTATFLHGDIKRIILAHFLLASANGVPAVVYGDEVGKGTSRRNIKIDPRDSNRGSLTAHDVERLKSQKIRDALLHIFMARSRFREVAFNTPKRILMHEKNVFAAEYKIRGGKLYVLANLNSKRKHLDFDAKGRIREALSINGASFIKGKITLPTHSGVWLASKG